MFQLTGESIVILRLLINRVISMNLRDRLNVLRNAYYAFILSAGKEC